MRFAFTVGTSNTRNGTRVEDVAAKRVAALRLILGTESFGEAFYTTGIQGHLDPTGRLEQETATAFITHSGSEDAPIEAIEVAEKLAKLFDQEYVGVGIEGMGHGIVSYKGNTTPEELFIGAEEIGEDTR